MSQLNDPTPEEDELDLSLKVAHIEMYKNKLRERERRKKVSREHQLICKWRIWIEKWGSIRGFPLWLFSF